MYKASIELGKINKSFKLKFGLIIDSETDKKSYSKLVSKFNYAGNDYLRVNPRPFITIDISSKNDEAWSTNQMVNLNKISLFSFIRALSSLIKEFKSVTDLFYYQNDKLTLNNQYLRQTTKDVIASNKHIRMQPCVVPDDEVQNKFYEGCVLCINTYDNFCYLTYSEMEYLLYELTHIDINQLSLQLLNTVTLFKNMESEVLPTKTISKSTDDELINNEGSRPYVKIEEPSTIPDI